MLGRQKRGPQLADEVGSMLQGVAKIIAVLQKIVRPKPLSPWYSESFQVYMHSCPDEGGHMRT